MTLNAGIGRAAGDDVPNRSASRASPSCSGRLCGSGGRAIRIGGAQLRRSTPARAGPSKGRGGIARRPGLRGPSLTSGHSAARSCPLWRRRSETSNDREFGGPKHGVVGDGEDCRVPKALQSEFHRGVARGVPDAAHAAQPIRADTATDPGTRGPSPSPPQAGAPPVSSRGIRILSPSGLDVPRRVHVAVVACRAHRAQLARGEEPVDGDEHATVPSRLVGELAPELPGASTLARTLRPMPSASRLSIANTRLS